MSRRFLLNWVVVENFKSVRQSGTVHLTPLTVFVGNNGSGKSSLIEGLETYRAIVLDGLDSAMDRWHGMEHVWNKSAAHRKRTTKDGVEVYENPMSFRLRGKLGRAGFGIRLDACSGAGGNSMRIEKETLRIPEGRLYERDGNGRCEFFQDRGFIRHGPPPGEIRLPLTEAEGFHLERVTTFLPGESASPPDWKDLVRRWQFLALEPQAMGEPARQRLAGGPAILNRDGSNLGQYLLSLREASVDAFNGLLEALQFVLPYVRDIQPVLSQAIERLVYLEMTEANFKIPGWLLSTGTLRVLAILACLRHPDPPPLLVVEEVENGLDPRTIHLLVEEIRAAIEAKTTQVIVTTHSPYLLDLLDLSHIVVVERIDGETTFHRPDAEELKEWSESFSPGRLYTMGRLTRGS